MWKFCGKVQFPQSFVQLAGFSTKTAPLHKISSSGNWVKFRFFTLLWIWNRSSFKWASEKFSCWNLFTEKFRYGWKFLLLIFQKMLHRVYSLWNCWPKLIINEQPQWRFSLSFASNVHIFWESCRLDFAISCSCGDELYRTYATVEEDQGPSFRREVR